MPSADTTTTTTLATNLRRLGFNRTADDLNDLIAQAARKRSSATVLLEHIVAAELEDKQRRSVESRLTRARLGRFKPFADWDWQWPTALDRCADRGAGDGNCRSREQRLDTAEQVAPISSG